MRRFDPNYSFVYEPFNTHCELRGLSPDDKLDNKQAFFYKMSILQIITKHIAFIDSPINPSLDFGAYHRMLEHLFSTKYILPGTECPVINVSPIINIIFGYYAAFQSTVSLQLYAGLLLSVPTEFRSSGLGRFPEETFFFNDSISRTR